MDEQPVRYVFGDIVVALDAETVTRAGIPVAVEPKAFRLLVFLIENRGRLLEKQETLDAVWDGAFVSDNALTRVIAVDREGRVLGAIHGALALSSPRTCRGGNHAAARDRIREVLWA